MNGVPLRLVIFDVDGTLVDSQGLIVAAMGAAFASAGLSAPDDAAVRATIGLSLPQVFARLCPDQPVPVHGRMIAAYKQAAMALREERGERAASPLFAGIIPLLEILHARPEILLGVATGKSKQGLDHTLATHDLHRFFITRQVADGHPSKPHPSMLLAALSETGTQARHAVMIGDTSYDMEMARAAGVTAIGVGWGYHAPASLLEAGAHSVAADVPALGRLLDDFHGHRR